MTATNRVADHPVDPQFPARWSPRAFTDATLTEAEVLTLLEAARWAPSAMNVQPWRFVWALRGEEGFAAIVASLAPGNQLWAPKAAALLVLASRTTRSTDSGEVPFATHAFDSGSAWVSLALQAQQTGLAAHAMGGFDHEVLAKAINLPEGHALHAVIAVGHPGPAEILPEALQSREAPSPRKPIEELAHRAKFAA